MRPLCRISRHCQGVHLWWTIKLQTNYTRSQLVGGHVIIYWSIYQNGTWSLVLIPPYKRPITTKWVFKLKARVNSRYHKHKGRLVAWVYNKQHNINFDEIFTLVIKWGSIKLMISIVTHHGCGIHQLDAKTTFLNGNLQEEVYIW